MGAQTGPGSHCRRIPELHIASFTNRPKDVQGCRAAPEECSFTAFLALFLFALLIVCVYPRRCYRKALAGMPSQWELVDEWALIPNPKARLNLWFGVGTVAPQTWCGITD